MILKIGFYHFAVMDSQIVQEQEHLATGIFDQSGHKLGGYLGGHGFTIKHKRNFSPIGD